VDSAAVAKLVKSILKGGGKGSVSVSGLDDPEEQIPNAETIQATGVAMNVPAQGQIVALATALQESGLRNLDYSDRDSLGLFQQRPSQGWGTAAEVRDPVHASTKFYEGLLKVSGWQSMTIAQAAQAVQKSGFPDAYAKWEPLATALQKAIAKSLGQNGSSGKDSDTGGESQQATSSAVAGCGTGEDGSSFGPIPTGSVPEGYEIPASAPKSVRTAIRWGLGQLGTPYQWGGTCSAPHGQDPMGRCDCSSLMQASYKAGGVSISRTTYTQVKEGKAVSVDDGGSSNRPAQHGDDEPGEGQHEGHGSPAQYSCGGTQSKISMAMLPNTDPQLKLRGREYCSVMLAFDVRSEIVIRFQLPQGICGVEDQGRRKITRVPEGVSAGLWCH
jgi:cell wall-associated NlpC family hydrolase